jgi:hypothetical protein
MLKEQGSGPRDQHVTGGVVIVKPAKSTKPAPVTTLTDIEATERGITIVGKSQLIVNNFGPKGAQQMEDQRSLTAEEKRSLKKGGKPAITPEEIERRFQNARLLNSKGQDCVKADWIKGALVSAVGYKEIGIPAKQLRGAVYVNGDLLPIKFTPRPKSESDQVITYYGKGPGMRRDVVRVGPWGKKQPDIRYRPCYDDWSISFTITFEPALISPEAMLHLIRRAGMSVGLCEWRPEGPGGGKGGQFGRFDLDLKVLKEKR